VKQLREESLLADGAAASTDCRCLCGSLLARLIEGGVELKCRRCKRTLLVPLERESELRSASQRTLSVNPQTWAG
jgi:phage FluMu protein Com